jgi:hypothetical protein
MGDSCTAPKKENKFWRDLKSQKKQVYLFLLRLLALTVMTGKFVARIAKQEFSRTSSPPLGMSGLKSTGIDSGKIRLRCLADFFAEKKINFNI